MNTNYVFMLAFAMIAIQSCANHNRYSQQSENSFKQDIEILIDTSHAVAVQSDSSLSHKWFMSLEEALESPDSVYYLSLRERGYKVFPQEILQFKNLRRLDISMNEFETLPDEITMLQNLESLTIAYSPLKMLPPQIGHLTNLRYLNLLDNKLTTLPESIGKLTNLAFLNLTLNPIEDLPKSMANLQKLESLGLYGKNGGLNPNFTLEKREKLEALLPNCKITFE